MGCKPLRAVLIAAILAIGTGSLKAADSEIRNFSIAIDGEPAGTYQMTISRQDDGTVTMVGLAQTQLAYVGGLYKYTFSYNGTETWKGGRLQRLDGKANDNGNKIDISAVADGNSLRVKVNGQDHQARSEAWTTTYWGLPDPRLRNQTVPLLDADTGRDIQARLQYIGSEPVTVARQSVNCAHWRLTGGVQVDLWYDGQERLVRQEWVEDGHKALLELKDVRR